jgi:uncharacterized metal-binding protein YceD (DUF177 family)
MHFLDHFSLPYAGMKDGMHEYTFTAGPDFFKAFDASLIEDGQFTIKLRADKRPGIMDLKFHVSGVIATLCDKCLADIQLPVKGEYSLHVKVGEGVSDDEEILFVRDDQPKLDLSQAIYEFICLSVPMVHVYACQKDNPPPCNQDVLKKLIPTDKAPDPEKESNVWEQLKNLDLN